jgi:ribosome biogenesis GTPase
MHNLHEYGWNPHFASHLLPDESPALVARVVQEHKEAYLVRAAALGMKNVWAEISGKIRHHAAVRADFPAVGDWVILRGLEHVTDNNNPGPVQITRILPRSSTLARRLDSSRGGKSTTDTSGDDQILAVNIDLAFLGTSLNENFNPRRLERYLALARDAGVQPVVLLTKADLCADPAPFIEQARAVVPPPHHAHIHAVSVVSNLGLDAVRAYLQPGITAVILGSSGVGKSTLVNYLAEADLQDMMETRDFDDKGRHCTTFRHLVRTPHPPMGGLIIDTPGLRGLALGEATDALAATFTDIESLAHACKFSDCNHDTEPGCAIKAALETGTLDPDRLESYLRMQREVAALARRENRIATRKQNRLEKRASAAQHEKQKRKWNQY